MLSSLVNTLRLCLWRAKRITACAERLPGGALSAQRACTVQKLPATSTRIGKNLAILKIQNGIFYFWLIKKLSLDFFRCTNWTGLVIAPPVCPLSPPVFPPSTDKPQTTPVPASTTTTAPPHTPATSKTEEASAVPVQVLPLVQTQSSLAECSKLFLSWPYLVFGTLLIIFAVVFTVLWCLLFRMKTLLADELKVIKDENLKHKNDIKDAKEELTVVSDALADNVRFLTNFYLEIKFFWKFWALGRRSGWNLKVLRQSPVEPHGPSIQAK